MVVLTLFTSYKLQLRNIRVFKNEKMRHSMDILVFERSFI